MNSWLEESQERIDVNAIVVLRISIVDNCDFHFFFRYSLRSFVCRYSDERDFDVFEEEVMLWTMPILMQGEWEKIDWNLFVSFLFNLFQDEMSVSDRNEREISTDE